MSVSLVEVKRRVESDLPDSTLQTILDAETEALERYAGKATETETHQASGSRKLVLHRRPKEITEITERRHLDDDPVTLSDDDWRFIGSRVLYRLGDGANPGHGWGAEVVVSYNATTDENLRDRVIMDLVQLSVEFRAYEREVDGDWEGFQESYNKRRQQLLNQIHEPRAILV